MERSHLSHGLGNYIAMSKIPSHPELAKILCQSLVAAAFAVTFHSGQSAAAPASAPFPQGVYALADQDIPIPQNVLSNSQIDGIALRYSWKALEPREGQFDWTLVDSEVAAARAHNKKVSIGVTAGVKTPSWVYAAGARSFTFTWNKRWGAPACSSRRIPIPWDGVYLEKWNAFVRMLGTRYADEPTIVYVKITGINATTQELILPHSRPGSISRFDLNCATGDEVAAWQAAGYTRPKIEQAWRGIADSFAAAFPKTKLGLMIGPAGMPPIDEFGRIIPNQAADRELSLRIINAGIERYGARLVVQNNGLSAVHSWSEIARLSGSAIVGWQMAWSATDDARCRMNGGMAPCSADYVLESAVTRGLGSGAAFLEIYTADILNPSLQATIARAHQRLAQRETGAPLHKLAGWAMVF